MLLQDNSYDFKLFENRKNCFELHYENLARPQHCYDHTPICFAYSIIQAS